MTKKIVVDQNKCIGCNTCPLICPKVFELDTNTYKATVKPGEHPIDEDVNNAIGACPVGAISVEEN
ncbi:MAG TPA: ferredoxin [Candidatus Woesebacteria bacterium]|nr:ferredoxin [Candidatus Woesebacteria bacterium]HPJ17169.1 ferredoxin [Candidatus Woesebacteria bacterium]